MASPVGRFAPSTTGSPHPGTLLSALLSWWDARSRNGRWIVRMEDLDPQRCKPEHVEEMLAALRWLGLDWDMVETQSDHRQRYAAALDRLASQGLLYACSCSRARIRAEARPAIDGGFVYPGTCRDRVVGPDDWRQCPDALRLRLPEEAVQLVDDGGTDCSQHPLRDMGDPVVRRKDGAEAYHLVAVVDDAAVGVTHVVRGRDLASSTAIQVQLQRMLAVPTPRYRHHFLLLEPRADRKLAKLHQSVSWQDCRDEGAAVCGQLASIAGLLSQPVPCTPQELLADFDWALVRTNDCPVVVDAAGDLQIDGGRS